jgi:tRNA (adenine37-N6)-methyltransferase
VRDRAWTGDQDAEAVTSRPVAHVIGGREDVFDDDWAGVEAVIGLDAAQFTQEALYGLEPFSHLEVVFFFNEVPLAKIETGARHPRGNADWPLVAPVLDIKPYMAEFGPRGEIRQPEWATEIMRSYY